MCHQSVGLVQGAIEATGIATISISVRPEVTINMLVPRAAYVRFPTGNPLGEPFKPDQQRTILEGVLDALQAITEPGTVLEMPYRWKRMDSVVNGKSRSGASKAETGFDNRAEQGAPPAGAASVEDAYSAASGLVSNIESAYVELMASIDSYRVWLEAKIAEEREKTEPDSSKLQALNPQLRYLTVLQEALEGLAHDGLVRVADRVVRIKHWQDGVFI